MTPIKIIIDAASGKHAGWATIELWLRNTPIGSQIVARFKVKDEARELFKRLKRHGFELEPYIRNNLTGKEIKA